ncbi:MAG: VTT domain-containing protein [Patescibacteria group bacterium]
MIELILYNFFYFFKQFGLFGAFLNMFVESIGIPIPIEIGYIVGWNLIELKKYSFVFVILVLTLGNITGGVVAFLIGRGGNKFVRNKLQRNNRINEICKKLESWYKKYGDITVFATRFMGYVRLWSSYIAGFANVKFTRFLFWTAFGSLIFNAFALYLVKFLVIIWNKYAVYHLFIIVGAFFVFFGMFIYQIIKSIANTIKK